MERAIAHLDLDSFFVSCERLLNSSLNGIPLIIGAKDRGVVASCSYEARFFGVRSAMPMAMAMRLCPQATVIKGDMQLYSNLSNQVTQIITENAPIVEKASIDEFYMDLSGMDKFFGTTMWMKELGQKIQDNTGLPFSYSLSINKTVAKIATTQAKPQGSLVINAPEVQPFLNPLSIEKIPQLGPVTYTTLSRLGIRQIQTLAQMPVAVLQQLLGKNGVTLWQKANGIDLSLVEPYKEQKSISKEHTFGQDTIDLVLIKSFLLHMIEALAFELRSQQWLCSVVQLKIRYANFDTHNKQLKIPYTCADHTISDVVLELFSKLYNRRMRIRTVGIHLSGLVRGTYQINLFEDTQQIMSLYQTMDKLKKKYGPDAVSRCGATLLDQK